MNQEEATAHKKKRDRSPGYPLIDLEAAIEKTKILYEQEGRHSAPVSVVIGHWGNKATSGTGFRIVAALMKYGLIEYEGSGEGKGIRISNLAERVLFCGSPESPDRLLAIKEAALHPPIYAKIWEKYQGDLPSDKNLEVTLIREPFHFNRNSIGNFIRPFRRTIEFAKLSNSDILSNDERDSLQEPCTGDMVAVSGKPGEVPMASPSIADKKSVIQLPLNVNTVAILEAPFPLSDQDWNALLGVLDILRPGLTKKEEPEG